MKDTDSTLAVTSTLEPNNTTASTATLLIRHDGTINYVTGMSKVILELLISKGVWNLGTEMWVSLVTTLRVENLECRLVVQFRL